MLQARGAARLVILFACLCVAGMSVAGPSLAAYPDHPVKIVVPFAAGGPTDVMARLIAQKLSEKLNQQFYVENHPGAGGNIGMVQVARATPDGYTIMLASSSFVVNPSLYANSPYDPYKDFSPVTLAAATPNILVVNPAVPAKTVKELIEVIRANPGKYPVGSPGIGTTPQLASELFKLTYKLDATSVPYNGAGPFTQALLAGQIEFGFVALPPTAAQVASGNLRGLAVTSLKRSSALPQVPTLAEAGVEGQESETMQGVLAPAGTPAEITALLNREIVKVMQSPDIKAKCLEQGLDIVADTPAEFAGYIRKEIDKWHKVIQDAKVPQIE
jgi:tripartite-type tricarboxylate transporter receptor subunit TctC